MGNKIALVIRRSLVAGFLVFEETDISGLGFVAQMVSLAVQRQVEGELV